MSEAEARVRSLEAEVGRLRVMLENAPSFIGRITLDGKFLYLNHLQPGYRMEDVLGSSVDDYVPPAYREQQHRAMQAAQTTRAVQEYATMGHTSPDRVGHYLTRVSPIVEGGAVTSLVMVATDVTALEEQRTLLQLALDASKLGTFTFDLVARRGTWDQATRRIFGATPDQAVPGMEVFMRDYLHPDDHAAVMEAVDRATADGRYGPIQYRTRLPDGRVRWIEATGVTTRDGTGTLARLVGTVCDITARRTFEARLREAEKLESVGRLAGGVAHDFNNMLTAILGNVSFAARAESMDELRQQLDEVRVAAERSAALTAQLLAFARRQIIEPKIVDPNALIRRVEPLLRRLLGERVQAKLALGATGCLRVGESQLEQVVFNLVANSRDALARGGTLTLETRDVVLDAARAEGFGELAPGAYVVLALKDDGPGIPSDVLPHIFEPFFSTREGGTGLGLATCYGIVKQFGGHIAVSSEVGRGATFDVYLPRVEGEVLASGAREAGPQAATERVLVVEDEPAVRRVIRRALEQSQVHVVVAENADEAMRLTVSDGPFDLLVTDVVMPDVDGRELARRLRAHAPGLRVLFISGYAQQFQPNEESSESRGAFLQKPFKPADLVDAVRRLLNGGS